MKIIPSLALSFLLFTFPSASRAQETPAALVERQKAEAKEEVTRLLKSGTPRDRAWAAHLCVKHGLKEFIPEIVAALDQAADISGHTDYKEFWSAAITAARERDFGEKKTPAQIRATARMPAFCANQAIFDALIRLDANVSSEKVLPFFLGHPDEVVALLARDARKNATALLEILVKKRWTSRSMRFAILSRLVQSKSPGVAAYLLEQPATLFLTVSETGTKPGIVDGALGTDYSVGPFDLPPDFPPTSVYRFNRGHVDPTNPLYCTDPIPVFLKRHESNAKGRVSGTIYDTWGSDEGYFAHIVALLDGAPDRYRDFPYYDRPLKWAGPARIKDQATVACREVHRDYENLKERLVAKGWLSRAEAGRLRLFIRMTFLADQRTDKTVPLPEIPVNFGKQILYEPPS